jgi:hypothetical protein
MAYIIFTGLYYMIVGREIPWTRIITPRGKIPRYLCLGTGPPEFSRSITITYESETSRCWWHSTNFESCVPWPTWMYGRAHVCTTFQNFWIA